METIISIFIVVSLVLAIGAISGGVARQMMNDNKEDKKK